MSPNRLLPELLGLWAIQEHKYCFCKGVSLECSKGKQTLTGDITVWLFPIYMKKHTFYIHWAQASSSSSHPRFCTCSWRRGWQWLPWRAGAALRPSGLGAQRCPPTKNPCPSAPCWARSGIIQKRGQRAILTFDSGRGRGVKMFKLQALLIQVTG